MKQYEAPGVESPGEPLAGFREVSVTCIQSIVSIVQYICPIHLDLHAIQRSRSGQRKRGALCKLSSTHVLGTCFSSIFPLYSLGDLGPQDLCSHEQSQVLAWGNFFVKESMQPHT